MYTPKDKPIRPTVISDPKLIRWVLDRVHTTPTPEAIAHAQACRDLYKQLRRSENEKTHL